MVETILVMGEELKKSYSVAHVGGWLVKMLVIRDVRLVLFCSILFEVVEFGLIGVFGNFGECWWDSVFIDLVICNGTGILIGFGIVRSFGIRCDIVGQLKFASFTHIGKAISQPFPKIWPLPHTLAYFKMLYFLLMVHLS
jgi:phosphatidylserine synthase 2